MGLKLVHGDSCLGVVPKSVGFNPTAKNCGVQPNGNSNTEVVQNLYQIYALIISNWMVKKIVLKIGQQKQKKYRNN